MRINVRNRVIFSEKLLYIEHDPATKTVTFVFDGGIKVVEEKVDFDKLKANMGGNSSGSVKCTVRHDALFDRIFGKDCSFTHDID